MLAQVVNLLTENAIIISDETLSINDYNVLDENIISNLENYIDQILDNNGNIIGVSDIVKNQTIRIHFSRHQLNSIGFYEKTDVFIRKHKSSSPTNFYIQDIGFNDSDNIFIKNYYSVINLIESISDLSKYTDESANVKTFVIFSEQKALVLPIIYNDFNIIKDTFSIKEIEKVATIFKENGSEKKILFINELIDFLSNENENERFVYLLEHFDEFFSKASSSFQYYIRNFSYNKLKTELDNVSLEYSRKIQSVINEAQTKLIAIPVAFVLATTNVDFLNILSVKNIVILISLYIFAILIQIFLNNQSSALDIINENIKMYKNSFTVNNPIVKDSFTLVDTELKKQKNRLYLTCGINWMIPLLVTLFFAISFL